MLVIRKFFIVNQDPFSNTLIVDVNDDDFYIEHENKNGIQRFTSLLGF